VLAATTTYPLRNKLIFLLSVHGGLRSKEISSLQWKMVTDSTGTLLKQIALTNEASKENSGRIIWISNELGVVCGKVQKHTFSLNFL
jgi:integrase